jgi:hypothetical protein
MGHLDAFHPFHAFHAFPVFHPTARGRNEMKHKLHVMARPYRTEVRCSESSLDKTGGFFDGGRDRQEETAVALGADEGALTAAPLPSAPLRGRPNAIS